jgi:MSHA biogenesis protein MshL
MALSTSNESDLFGELGQGVQALLSESGRMHVDRSAGLVQVTDFADRLDQIGVYVEAVQLRATRQVRIEARVFQLTLSDPAATIDWKAAAARSGAIVGTASGRAVGMRVDDFDALKRALGEQGTVTMIAAPQVVAMNNEPAVMRAGTQGVYFTTASQLDPAGRLERTSTPAAILEGLTLTVTAQIASDGIVQLSVAPTYTEKTGESKSAAGDIVPVLQVSEADTLVRVQDGDTVVISGFLQDRLRARPGGGLAGFFGAQAREMVKSDLVILLTPRVVNAGGTEGSR